MDTHKVRQDLLFYFWVGIILYVTSCVLNIIHLYQWKGRAWTDFFFHLFLLSVNVSLITWIRDLKDGARKLYMWKFSILALAFYPQVLLAKSGGWVYSSHWPHGVFQRVSNMGLILYEIWLLIYLTKRSVRFVFKHPAQ